MSVLLFACSAAPDRPAETARFGMARSGEDPAPEPQAAGSEAALPQMPVPVPQAGSQAPPAGEPLVEPDAVSGVPAPQGPVTFGSVPEAEAEKAAALSRRVRPEVGGSRVFSNKDLESYKRVKEEFGFRENVLVVDLSAQQAQARRGSDPLSPEERDRQVSETRGRIEAISEEIQHLKARIPSLHNPFLPRAKVSEADAVDEAGMDNAERLARVNKRIADLNGELGTLQRKLADLMAAPPADTED
jgi:hypothetical protein